MVGDYRPFSFGGQNLIVSSREVHRRSALGKQTWECMVSLTWQIARVWMGTARFFGEEVDHRHIGYFRAEARAGARAGDERCRPL